MSMSAIWRSSGGEYLPSFKCKDIGMECGFEAKSWTQGGLMKKVQLHAAEAHNMKEIPTDVLEKIKKAIK